MRLRLLRWCKMRGCTRQSVFKLLTLISLTGLAYQVFQATRTPRRIMIHQHQARNTSVKAAGTNTPSPEEVMELRTDVKRILYWTTFNNKDNFQFGLGPEPFQDCPHVKTCEAVKDRNLLEYSDAVVFNLNNIDPEDMPATHIPSQYWVVVNGESPYHSQKIDIDGLFNLTMSYKKDSSILFSHGKVIHLSEKEQLTFERSYAKYNWAQGKTKLVAWFVSHCETPSRREQFVRELKKFIPVDVYGACGPLNCGKGNYECDTILAKYYKFYLSFENSFCKDYVTEKLWNPLMKGVVPVVMGYANYKSFLPNNSYVDVKDFKYARQLAQHLQKLNDDDDEYNKYFEWRKTQKVVSMRFRDSFCQLCEMLHQENPPEKVIEDFGLWNSEQLNCQTPLEYYSTMIDRRAWLEDAKLEEELMNKTTEELSESQMGDKVKPNDANTEEVPIIDNAPEPEPAEENIENPPNEGNVEEQQDVEAPPPPPPPEEENPPPPEEENPPPPPPPEEGNIEEQPIEENVENQPEEEENMENPPPEENVESPQVEENAEQPGEAVDENVQPVEPEIEFPQDGGEGTLEMQSNEANVENQQVEENNVDSPDVGQEAEQQPEDGGEGGESQPSGEQIEGSQPSMEGGQDNVEPAEQEQEPAPAEVAEPEQPAENVAEQEQVEIVEGNDGGEQVEANVEELPEQQPEGGENVEEQVNVEETVEENPEPNINDEVQQNEEENNDVQQVGEETQEESQVQQEEQVEHVVQEEEVEREGDTSVQQQPERTQSSVIDST